MQNFKKQQHGILTSVAPKEGLAEDQPIHCWKRIWERQGEGDGLLSYEQFTWAESALLRRHVHELETMSHWL